MLDGIEALIALERFGTVSEAAIRLRLTQSAVSKRIMNLEKQMNLKLIVPDGRKVKLTHQAFDFLNKARPHFIELTNIAQAPIDEKMTQFSLGLSDSIAGSFGPRLIKEFQETHSKWIFNLHVHRSMMLIENISLGKYQIGLCTNYENRPNIIPIHLIDEPMVFISSQLSLKAKKNMPIITIEENSATFKNIGPKIKLEYKALFTHLEFIHVESFLAVYQMVKAGLGHGMIPMGLARELGLKKNQYKILKISRPISLVCRKNFTTQEFFEPFISFLKKKMADYFNYE